MKTLGGRTQQIARVSSRYILLLLTAASIAVGVLLGRAVASRRELVCPVRNWAMNCLRLAMDRNLLAIVVTGLLCALMFSLYPLLRLMKVPPLRVLRTGADRKRFVTVVYIGV